MNGQWTPEMELGGSPVSSSGNNNNNYNSDSLNGLKFGKKIYFENVGAGSSSVAGARNLLPATKRGRGGLVQGGATPRCQVEGCEADLSDVKAYYLRHKVCGMHSKSPTVIVAGLEQRFCQQCSRFHQLPEFDQGKRSCRRRLACHNERRRKPPSGSLLSAHFGSLSSSIFENNSRSGSFLVDFSAPPNLNESAWPNTRATEQGWDPQNTAPGKFLQRPWINNSNSHQSATAELVLQGSGDCSLGASDSSGALSLLSNRSYGSRNRPSVHGVNSVINIDDAAHIVPNHFSSPSLGYNKGNEASSSSHEMPLRQISQAANNQYPGELGMAQHSGQQYMELDHSKGYHPSVQNVHWTL